MAFMTDAQLASMRESISGMLPDSCTVQQLAISGDGAGGLTESWTTRASGVACRLDPFSQATTQLQETGQAEGFRQMYRLTLAYNATIEVGDRVFIGTMTYEVRIAHDAHSWRVSKRFIVARLT